MQVTIYYVLSSILLIIYGTQVCPYLDTLPVSTLSIIIASWTLFFLAVRSIFQKLITRNNDKIFKRQFLSDIVNFALLGGSLTFYNMAVYGFPLASGLKLFFGCLVMGFFASSDFTMALEYRLINELPENDPERLNKRFLSLTVKFTVIAVVLAVITAGILILVIFHDLEWIKTVSSANIEAASKGVITEIVFVISVLLLLTAKLVFSYTRNLRLYFRRQTDVLLDVERGKLDSHVPVTTTDEFGVIASYTNRMIEGLKNRTEELARTQDVTIVALASLAETRDNETGRHIVRTQNYMKALAEDLKEKPGFGEHLTEEVIELLFKSAPLHDIGKVGIPDNILLKNGPLTDEEFTIMKRHPILGRDALMEAEAKLGENSFLRFAKEIAYTHHERWDGTGYPEGLKGDDIPVSGRLMAISDVYDALISKRVYKKAFSHEKAREIIVQGSGTHFDPVVVDSFLKIEEEFREIAENNSDR